MRNELTSANNPLRVDFVARSVLPLAGRIGMTIAPGKKIDGIYGHWNRDLETDLVHLKAAYRAHVLVCLLEKHEFGKLQILDLVPTAERLGLKVLQLPIPDVSVCEDPDDLYALVQKIMGLVERGATVVIHCRGGKGRSGMVAACCLGAAGLESSFAIGAVREARRGTIETSEQEQAVRDFCERVRRCPIPKLDLHEAPSFSHVLGCLVGGAVGDALGYPIEFVGSGEQILAQYGKQAPRGLDYANGSIQVSDDTQMTLFMAEGIIRAIQRHNDRGLCHIPGVLSRALLRWYETQTMDRPADVSKSNEIRTGWLRKEQRLYRRRAPGNTCLSSLAKLARNPEAKTKNDRKGCGAIMRVAPIGLAAGDRERAFRMGCESGQITHGHALGYLPAGYLASVVFDLSRGVRLPRAMQLADDILRGMVSEERQSGQEEIGMSDEKGAAKLLRWTARAREASTDLSRSWSPKVIEVLGAGWTGEEALAVSLCCALTVNDGTPEEVARALWAAAEHAGDSDSTAAITGNILGASYGIGALPKAWAEKVELGDIIERLASDLYLVSILGEDLDFEEYPPN